MSLVAYGASDESETSDVDDAEVLPKSSNANNNVGKMDQNEDEDNANYDDGKISDEEDYVPTAVKQNAASSSTEMNIPFPSIPAPTTLSDLPMPKAAVLTSTQGEGEGEDELEEEVKPKPAQLADAPKPPPKKGKQPTRIVIPALKQDCDEEEEDKKKRSKQQAPAGSGSRSGLFALLPPPVHNTKKETNRPLIPYTLTKRPAPSKTNQPPSKGATPSSTTSATSGAAEEDLLLSRKHQSAFNALTGYESDSDEEQGGPRAAGGDLNFFSLGSKAGGAPTSSEVSAVKDSASEGGESKGRTLDSGDSSDRAVVESSSLPSSSQPKQARTSYSFTESPVSSSTSVLISAKEESAPDGAAQSSTVVNNNDDDSNTSGGENEVSSTVGTPLFNQDAPLNFNSSAQGRRGWSAAPLTSPMMPEMYAATSSSSGTNYWQQHEHYAQDYSAEAEPDDLDLAPGSSGGSDVHQYMEDEQFLRISGKRKHKQEDIQIIDANVDDYVDPSDLMKGITEESSYQPHRKKENMPSMQQKRKKQITYLAFQAKERELELKNAWSQGRMSKNQARSKYGF